MYTLYVYQDNGAKTIIDGVTKADHYADGLIVTTDTFTVSMNAGQSYSLVIYLLETFGWSSVKVYRSTQLYLKYYSWVHSNFKIYFENNSKKFIILIF